MKSILVAIFLCSSTCFGAFNYHLYCFNKDAYTDLGKSEIFLSTTLTVNGDNDYVIEGGDFKFSIFDWTNQSVKVKKVSNYANYRPRVHFGFAKFPSISPMFFGIADLLIPHEEILKGTTEFDGIFILSWVEDHWGGTISSRCQLVPLQ